MRALPSHRRELVIAQDWLCRSEEHPEHFDDHYLTHFNNVNKKTDVRIENYLGILIDNNNIVKLCKSRNEMKSNGKSAYVGTLFML